MARLQRRPIDRVVQRVIAGFVVFYAINATVAFHRRFDEDQPLSTGLIVACFTLAAIVGVRAWRGRLNRLDIAAAVALMLAALVLNHLWETDGIGDIGGPAYAGVSIALFVEVVVLRPIAFTTAGLTTVLVYAGGRAYSNGVSGWWNGFDEGLSHLGFEVAFVITLVLLRRADHDAQTALAADVRAEAERASAHAAQRAHRVSQRILHDDVIASLTAIELNQGSVDAARAAAHRAQEAFDLHDSTTGGATRIALEPFTATVHTNFGSEPVPDFIPDEVAGALALASMEALRNVERHSGADEVWLDRTIDDTSITITIRDEGRGFVSSRTSGFGVLQGIHARMREVGGEAHIESAPGVGTTVRLFWARPAETEAIGATGDRQSDVTPYLPVIAGGVLLMETWLPLRHAWAGPQPLVLAWTALASAMLTLGLSLAVRHESRRLHLLVLLSGQIMLLWANVSIVGAAELPSFRTWIIEFLGAFLLVVGFAYSVRLAIASGLAVSGTIAAIAATSPDVTVAASSAAITEPLLVTGGAAAMAAGIRRSLRIARERRNRALETGRRASVALITTRELRRHLAALRTSIVPFLDGIVDGTLDPADPGTRGRARQLALEARDELYLHDLLDDELRHLIREARLAGCNLTIRWSERGPRSPAIAAMLRHALDPHVAERAVMILPDRAGGETRLRMSPPLTAERTSAVIHALSDLQATVVNDDESTTVSVRG